jgi:hypothetical protein
VHIYTGIKLGTHIIFCLGRQIFFILELWNDASQDGRGASNKIPEQRSQNKKMKLNIVIHVQWARKEAQFYLGIGFVYSQQHQTLPQRQMTINCITSPSKFSSEAVLAIQVAAHHI